LTTDFPATACPWRTLKDVEPQTRERLTDLWNNSEQQINALDWEGSKADDFRRALAVLARDVQILYGELQKLKLAYENLKAKQKGGG
jgi:hypothetical protein